jgi:hypothetical protein
MVWEKLIEILIPAFRKIALSALKDLCDRTGYLTQRRAPSRFQRTLTCFEGPLYLSHGNVQLQPITDAAAED